MRKRIDIDHTHSRAICREIGERLQAYLKPEPELPAHLGKHVDQLRELEGKRPSMVPNARGEPRGDRPRWPWRKRTTPIPR